MKTTRRILIRVALGCVFGLAAVAAGEAGASAAKSSIPAHYQKIKFPQWTYTPPFPPDYRVELAGGAIAYLVPDTTLDLLKVEVYSAYAMQPKSPGETASLRLYSSLLKDGGAGALSPEQLEDSLEFVAAEMGAGLSDWQGSLSLDCLSGNGPELMNLLPDLALKPRLDSAVFRINQRTMVEGLRHRYDTPRGVMGKFYEMTMQGSHPANWSPTEKEVSGTPLKELEVYRGMGFPTSKLVLAVAGKFDKPAMIERLNTLIKRFGSGKPARDPRPFRGPLPPGVYWVDKPFTQATIRIAAPGVMRPSPDYYPLTVASYILGDGGFTSRLVAKVRSQEGLAYGVSSDIESDYHRRGSVSVGLQTKVETGAYAIRLVLDEIAKMAKEGISDEELAKAKDGLLKSLPSLFDSPAATASIFAQSEIWGRKPDHFLDYEKTIKGLTKTQVEDVFRKYFVPDSMRIMVVGPKAALLSEDAHGLSLKSFGKVVEMNTADLDKRE